MNGKMKNCVLLAIVTFLGMTAQIEAQDVYLWNDEMLYQDEYPWQLAGWGNLTASYDVCFYYDTSITVRMQDSTPFHFLDTEYGSTSAEVMAYVDPAATYHIISELYLTAVTVGFCEDGEYYDIFDFWWYDGQSYGDWWFDFTMMAPAICIYYGEVYVGNCFLDINTPPRVLSATWYSAPGNPDDSRKTIGLGEWVSCWTDPPVSVAWRVTGCNGSFDVTQGITTTFMAPQDTGYCDVVASMPGTYQIMEFNVIAPSSEAATKVSDSFLGTVGPPNTWIGASSMFQWTVAPITVSFERTSFRENIPLQTYTWPDGTQGSRSAFQGTFSVDVNNQYPDNISSGLDSISRLFKNSTYQDFSVDIDVPLEYLKDGGNWIPFVHANHPRSYRGSDQAARVGASQDNMVWGFWQGPYSSYSPYTTPVSPNAGKGMNTGYMQLPRNGRFHKKSE